MMRTRQRNQTTFGFVLQSVQRGDGRQFMAQFQCHRCPATIDVTPSMPLNPEGAAARAKNKGWDADGFNKTVTRCPACKARRTTATSIKEPIMAQAPTTATAKPATMALPKSSAGVVVLEDRKPNPDQRLKIRGALDTHFDDAKGVYLAGYSDHRVAEELNLPRIWVEQIREAAYGPLLADPALVELRTEGERLAQRLEALERRAADAARTFGAELSDARTALAGFNKRIVAALPAGKR